MSLNKKERVHLDERTVTGLKNKAKETGASYTKLKRIFMKAKMGAKVSDNLKAGQAPETIGWVAVNNYLKKGKD